MPNVPLLTYWQMFRRTDKLGVGFGLIPIRPVEETLFYVDVEPASREIMQTTPYIPNPTGNMGTLNRMSLNFGYEIPVVRSSYHRGHHR